MALNSANYVEMSFTTCPASSHTRHRPWYPGTISRTGSQTNDKSQWLSLVWMKSDLSRARPPLRVCGYWCEGLQGCVGWRGNEGLSTQRGGRGGRGQLASSGHWELQWDTELQWDCNDMLGQHCVHEAQGGNTDITSLDVNKRHMKLGSSMTNFLLWLAIQ